MLLLCADGTGVKTDTIQGRTCTHAQRTEKIAAKYCSVRPPLQLSFPWWVTRFTQTQQVSQYLQQPSCGDLGQEAQVGCRRPPTCTCIPPLRPKLFLWAMQRVETLQEETPVSRQPVPSTGQLALTGLWCYGQNKGKGKKPKSSQDENKTKAKNTQPTPIELSQSICLSFKAVSSSLSQLISHLLDANCSGRNYLIIGWLFLQFALLLICAWFSGSICASSYCPQSLYLVSVCPSTGEAWEGYSHFSGRFLVAGHTWLIAHDSCCCLTVRIKWTVRLTSFTLFS